MPAKIQAYTAMAEARLGHFDNAEAALARYRHLWAVANPKATTPTPLQIEVEQTVHEASRSPVGSR